MLGAAEPDGLADRGETRPLQVTNGAPAHLTCQMAEKLGGNSLESLEVPAIQADQIERRQSDHCNCHYAEHSPRFVVKSCRSVHFKRHSVRAMHPLLNN